MPFYLSFLCSLWVFAACFVTLLPNVAISTRIDGWGPLNNIGTGPWVSSINDAKLDPGRLHGWTGYADIGLAESDRKIKRIVAYSPTASVGLENRKKEAFNAAITDDGRVWFWGTVQESTWMFRIVMNTLQTTWVPVSPNYGVWSQYSFTDVAIAYHAVALLSTDRKVYTVGWGNQYNFTALLGRRYETWDTPVFQWPIEVDVSSPQNTWLFSKVFGGTWNFFALSPSGLVGWGLNFNGQLAQDPTSTSYSTVPIQISLPQVASTLAVSSTHVLAVTGDGSVYAWGFGASGQLGVDPVDLGPLGYRYAPAKIASLSGIVSVLADDGRSAAITSSGALLIFGDFPSYLISGSPWVSTPVSIAFPDYKIRGGCMRKSSITSAMRFMMVGENRTAIELFSAGDNYDGELMLITQETRVSTLKKASALTEVAGDVILDVACSDETTTVLVGSGKAYTWTDRSTTIANRELSLRPVPGLLDNMSDYPTPTIVDSRAAMSQGGSVLNYAGIKKVSARHAIAMITDETSAASPLVFWGQNPPLGIFGANSIVRRVGFSEAPLSQNWIDVSVGYSRAFFLHESGELWWTGEFSSASAQDGIVRIGKYANANLPPLKWIIALYQSEIGVTSDGDVWTLGQLYNSTSQSWSTDTSARLLSPALEWKGGFQSEIKEVQGNWYCELGNCSRLSWNVYILLEDGTMLGLGSNNYGQLCQNLTSESTAAFYTERPTLLPPVPPNDHGTPTSVVSFAVGGGFFVALFNQSSSSSTNAYGCGANHHNQFGQDVPSYWEDGQSRRFPTYSPTWRWVRLWWLWDSERGSQPVQVVATTETMHMLTDKGRLWSWGNEALIQSTTGRKNDNAAMPQLGVTETRKFKRLFVSEYSVFAESEVFVEPYLQTCGTSAARYPTEMVPKAGTAIRLSGYGLGDTLSAIQVMITFSNSSATTCTPTSITSDSSDTRKRVLTCVADLSTAPVGVLSGQMWVSNEISNVFVAGTIIPSPELTKSTDDSMYSHADSSTNFVITGSNFGSCDNSMTVSLQSQRGVSVPCIVKQVNDSVIICQTTSGLSANTSATVTVSRIGAITSAEAYFAIVASPVVKSGTKAYPNSVRELEIFGENFGTSARVVVSGSDCEIAFQNSTYVNCILPTRFSEYTGFVDAVVYANQGSSGAPVTVGSLTFPPVAASNNKGLVAAGADEISIRGLRFGSLTEVEVSLVVNTTATKRSILQYPCTVSNIVIDTSTLSGEEILFCVPQTGQTGIPSGQVSAVVNRNGGTTQIALGSIVPDPSITVAQLPTWARTIAAITISGANFAPSPSHLSNMVTLSNSNCSVTSATVTQIVCSMAGPVMSGSQLSASVKTYGASTPQVVISNLIDPPFINATVDTKIPTRSTSVTIQGQNFAAVSSTIQLYLNGLTKGCRPQSASTSQTIVCSVDETDLDEIGSLFAVVGSFGVLTDKIQIGVVERSNNDGSGVNQTGGLDLNGTIGVAVGVVAFVIVVLAVTAIIIRRYKHNQDIKLRDAALKISEEAKGLFNIKASDLTVISKLGEGSFGAVYLGKYKGTHVAIKRLATNVLASQINDFFREAAVMLSLKKHRNIVTTFGMCQEQSNWSMVMEFLPNATLLQLCERIMEESGELLTEDNLWKILRGVALGMSALASQGIVHRDLAARNILLDMDLEPRISDFGFSRNVGDQGAGQTNSTIGPVKWMSPESLKDRVYSEKSDVWSFGCLIYEVVSCQPPFAGEDLLSAAVKVRDNGANTLDLFPPEHKYPRYLDQIMKMCFIVDPAARPSFDTLVHIFDEHVPVGVQVPRGPGWMAENVLSVIQNEAPRERRRGTGKGTGETSEEKAQSSSVWDSDSDSSNTREQLARVRTNYIDTV